MKKLKILFLFISFILLCSKAEKNNEIVIPKNEYGLEVIDNYSLFARTVDLDSNKALINLEDYISGIELDIRYATENNFSGQAVYDYPLAFTRLPVAKALKSIQDSLKKENLALKIYDAYRPYDVTLKFYNIVKDTNFVATPWGGSRHNRGCAVDVSIIDLNTGREIAMPTEFDDFSEKANPTYSELPDSVLQNRSKLISVMNHYGFTVYPTEWWHYDFQGWENYELLDIPFDTLLIHSK